MPASVKVIKTGLSERQSIRNARINSYMGAKVRLANARQQLNAALAEFEAAIMESDNTRQALDAILLECEEDSIIEEGA